MFVHKGDRVQVISGAYKGTIGEVKAAFPKENKVIVEGVAIVKKHLKPSQQSPEGGIIETEAKIDASNVMVYDEKAKRPDKVAKRVEYDKDGRKIRYRVFKKSGNRVEFKKK